MKSLKKKKKEITKVPLLLDAVTFNMDSAKKTNEIAQVQWVPFLSFLLEKEAIRHDIIKAQILAPKKLNSKLFIGIVNLILCFFSLISLFLYRCFLTYKEVASW